MNPASASAASGSMVAAHTSFSSNPPSPPFNAIIADGLSPSEKFRGNTKTHAERCSHPTQFSSLPEVPAYPNDPCFVTIVNVVNRPCFASTTPSHALVTFTAVASRYISTPCPFAATKSSRPAGTLNNAGYDVPSASTFAAPANITNASAPLNAYVAVSNFRASYDVAHAAHLPLSKSATSGVSASTVSVGDSNPIVACDAPSAFETLYTTCPVASFDAIASMIPLPEYA
eukprot:31125-Pelagococcus_subviridis.AAC.32